MQTAGRQPAEVRSSLLQSFPHGHYIYANALEDVKLRTLRERHDLDVGLYYCLPWFLISSFRFG
jgi:hypothetical protein